jgi:hypothetical protein
MIIGSSAEMTEGAFINRVASNDKLLSAGGLRSFFTAPEPKIIK